MLTMLHVDSVYFGALLPVAPELHLLALAEVWGLLGLRALHLSWMQVWSGSLSTTPCLTGAQQKQVVLVGLCSA